MTPTDFRAYIQTLRVNISQGNATEHTHRSALQALVEANAGFSAINEPRRIDCGAPDFAIVKSGDNSLSIAYIETKDVDANLDNVENDEQLKRYRAGLSNLILTNYTEFRWYVDGELRGSAVLANIDGNGRPSIIADGIYDTGVLLGNFLSRSPESVGDSVELARRMARLTHIVRDAVRAGFEQGLVSSDVQDLYLASQECLVPDLSADAFADMFAQTLAYGLFAARVNHPARDFSRHTAAHFIPPTNPFIRRIFGMVAGPSLDDEPFVSFVDDLTQLLGNADMSAILADFGKRTIRQDPIMNFYETFLAAYDPDLRERRGVYYTPEPVIGYIVRSVDHLLRERLGCAEGLADYAMTNYRCDDGAGNVKTGEAHRVLVLDPACGTGSFLYAVIDHIRERYHDAGLGGMWAGYVKEHLLPRLFGFELLMAPYAMGHLKLGMQLAARDLPDEQQAGWAYEFDSNERLRVYLTNSLEQTDRQTPVMFGPLRVITEEANAAAEVKRDLPIMVVLGNPPYSGHSSNKGEWISGLIDDYKRVDGQPLGERNTKWLQDDYVKFIRFGQWRIKQSGSGILAFITNHAYLNNPTFRGMRQQLLDTFTDIYLLDLHGNSRTRERAPDGGVDENVFDIQQGVAIAIFVKAPDRQGPAAVHHADLWGTRDAKYAALSELEMSNTDWEELRPAPPDYRFKPWDNELEAQYLQWPKISDVIPIHSAGIVTARDSLTIRWSRDEVMTIVRDFAGIPPETARDKYNLGGDVQDWKVRLAQDDLNAAGVNDELAVPILYRPYDTRYTYYTGKTRGFICRPRPEVMRHLLADGNLALITTRQTTDQWGALATQYICGHKTCAAQDINTAFPLYIYPAEQEIATGLYDADYREPNLAPDFTAAMESGLGLRFTADGPGDLQATFGPEDVFHYIYAVFHSPAYRERYDQFLRADFPRVPFPRDAAQFRTLAGLGQRLTNTHLLRSPELAASTVAFPVAGDSAIARGYPKYTEPNPAGGVAQGRVNINRRQYFEGIAPEVWQFRIGGYQPMDKWLKDRRGRVLSFDDIDHYRRMAAAIGETINLMERVDRAIEETGGLFGTRTEQTPTNESIPYPEKQRKAHAIYAAKIRPLLAPGDEDKYVMIDIVSGDYEIGENRATLVRILRERRPDAIMHTIHRHQSYQGRIRSPRRVVR